eukprot:TRINITY_DN9089_c0_g1_i1.p1 TRINITY_DN9089_c0_g1~~TRINITY_DN9089_c0_g1_i1.p1  ORF type:complete len:223 (+),score=24.06 TRINITY_DN9089_c0_g1_i1:69-671(+)
MNKALTLVPSILLWATLAVCIAAVFEANAQPSLDLSSVVAQLMNGHHSPTSSPNMTINGFLSIGLDQPLNQTDTSQCQALIFGLFLPVGTCATFGNGNDAESDGSYSGVSYNHFQSYGTGGESYNPFNSYAGGSYSGGSSSTSIEYGCIDGKPVLYNYTTSTTCDGPKVPLPLPVVVNQCDWVKSDKHQGMANQMIASCF